MNDPRITLLAEILLDHSCQIKAGENVLVEAIDLPDPALVCRLVELAAARGARPFVTWKNQQVLRALYRAGTEASIGGAGDLERMRMERMQAYIGIRGGANSSEFSDVPHDLMGLYRRLWWHPVHTEVRVPHTRWVVLRYPSPSMAQAAGMSTSAFEDFYFDVCTADYARMGRDQEPLARRMAATDRVRITGAGTDLSFSLRGMPARPCHGQRNIPDGEVYTAPVRDSVEGTIRFNAASRYEGTVFERIELEFRAGRVERASCANAPEALAAVLDTDDGARFLGEFAIGCNNRICRPMLDTLFDEKIGGSLHVALGNAYDECDNGNRSRVHWDLVLMQTPPHGGEIFFDGELIRRDGLFVPADLQGLNEGLTAVTG